MDKRRIGAVLVIAGLAFSGLANAEVYVKEYLEAKAKGGSQYAFYQGIVLGMGSGYDWSNAALTREKRAPLYCSPETATFTGNDYVKLVDLGIEQLQQQDIGQPAAERRAEKVPVALVLLKMLQHRYPCPGALSK